MLRITLLCRNNGDTPLRQRPTPVPAYGELYQNAFSNASCMTLVMLCQGIKKTDQKRDGPGVLLLYTALMSSSH